MPPSLRQISIEKPAFSVHSRALELCCLNFFHHLIPIDVAPCPLSTDSSIIAQWHDQLASWCHTRHPGHIRQPFLTCAFNNLLTKTGSPTPPQEGKQVDFQTSSLLGSSASLDSQRRLMTLTHLPWAQSPQVCHNTAIVLGIPYPHRRCRE